jgi:hypothetical protein
MKLARDPFPLVFARGDESTKLACLELFGFSESPQAQACLLKSLAGHRSDGAFPSQSDRDTWGTMETVRNTLLLIKLGLPPSGVNVVSAVRFILANQRPDGGWYPFFDDAGAPVYTVLAVKALILSGALPREDLKAWVTRFTMAEGGHDLADQL